MSAQTQRQSKALPGKRRRERTTNIHRARGIHPASLAGRLQHSLHTGRALVVDDDAGVLELVSKMVAHLGYRPTMAVDGVEALQHLARARFDLVITDYDMPFIDGYQLADQIKERYFGTRVIIMTGHLEEDVGCLADSAGVVDGLLFKPFSLATMKAKIETVCRPLGHWSA
jgi:CheY-like chemotaxis protein